jgi:hypothetical protein
VGKNIVGSLRGQFPLQLLDEGGDLKRFDGGEFMDAARRAPLCEAPRR